MSAKRKRQPARSNPGSTARPRSPAGHNPAVDSKPATRHPMPGPGHGPAVTIGTAVFSQGLEGPFVSIENHVAMARFSIPVESVRLTPTDYRGPVTSHDPPYNGQVLSTRVEGGRVTVAASTGTALDETRVEYLAPANIEPAELVWSMTQMGGLPSDGRFIQGFSKRPSRFAVIMPVAGVAGDLDRVVGPVAILGNRAQVASMLGNLGDPGHAAAFLGHAAWAIAEAQAGTVWEAEGLGVPLIEQALDRLAVTAQYSLATDPSGEPIPFVRDSLFGNPVAIPLVLVVEGKEASPRRCWLRDRSERIRLLPLSATRIGFQLPDSGKNPTFDEGVRAWRRAVLSTDPIAAALALSEAIEFYASGVAVPSLLSDKEASAVRAALSTVTLGPDQRQRVDAQFATINEAPLMVRFRAALVADHVPFSDEDLVVLGRLRRQRNDALHGRQRGTLTLSDLEMARGFVNRMLVFWAAGSRMQQATGTG